MAVGSKLSTKIANASVFAAMMVVAIHTAGRSLEKIPFGTALWWFEAFGHWGIFLIAVPFFFVCSGYFLASHTEEPTWWRRECSKRLKSLFVPYLAWNLAFAFLPLAIFLMANLAHGRVAFMPMEHGFWIGTLGLSPFKTPRYVPMWYLRTLMIFVGVSPVLLYSLKKWGMWFLLVLYAASLAIGVWRVCIPVSRVMLFFTECFHLQGLFFFCCGMFGRIKDVRLPQSGHVAALVTGAAIVALSAFAILRFNVNLIPAARIVFTPLLLFGLWGIVPQPPLPNWLTGTTFAVYVMHAIVFQAMRIIFHFQVETILQWFTKWMLGFGLPVAMALVMRKICPGVAKVVFGGR